MGAREEVAYRGDTCLVLRTRVLIAIPQRWHNQRLQDRLILVPLLLKPVVVCMQTEDSDENWIENEREPHAVSPVNI